MDEAQDKMKQIDKNKFDIKKAQSNQENLQESIEVLGKQIDDYELINENFAVAYETICSVSDQLNDDTRAIVDNVLAGIEFTEIAYSSNIFKVSGLTLTEVEALDYARKIRETGLFDQVTVTKIGELCSATSQEYTLTLKVEGCEYLKVEGCR